MVLTYFYSEDYLFKCVSNIGSHGYYFYSISLYAFKKQVWPAPILAQAMENEPDLTSDCI